MRKKIFRTICTLVILVVIAAASMTFLMYYNQIVHTAKSDLRNETEIIAMYLNNGAAPERGAFSKAYTREDGFRVTLISAGGDVVFDTGADSAEMENHLERPEVASAIKSGRGESTRESETISSENYYYAIRLDNGDIIRTARRVDSTIKLAMRAVPFMILIIVFVTLLAVVVADRLTKNIMRPIYEIDLDNPDYSAMYEELKPLFRKIADENAEKARTEQIRREFSANVSHELRTPMTTISGYAQMIENGMVKQEDVREFGHRIASESDRLILLINDIIRLSRLDELDGVDMAEKLDLSEIVEESICVLQPSARKKNVQIYYSGEPAYIRGNRTMISELVRNIIDNAIKYNKDSGRVNIFSGKGGSGVELDVKDTGIGIPEEDCDRIFERFYRVDKSHSKTVGGTGLGLSIVKHVAICHDAKISVKSRLGEGTQINVVFKSYEETESDAENNDKNRK